MPKNNEIGIEDTAPNQGWKRDVPIPAPNLVNISKIIEAYWEIHVTIL